MYYAGIGSRKTPPQICNIFKDIANLLEFRGVILRSGGANGADLAFESGVNSNLKEIYLPYKGFNKSKSHLYGVCDNAITLAKKFHPAWNRLSPTGKLLISRNGYQVLGPDLNTPSSFIIAWTLDGKMVGGTAQALRIATEYKIPIFNFGKNPKSVGYKLSSFIDALGK
jgi:hypothetical protein